MKNKYEEAFDEIVFKIACLFFPEPITKSQIALVEGWASFSHIDDIIHRLNPERENPEMIYKVDKVEL